MSTSYNPEFYADQQAGSRRSADVILPLIFSIVKPKSVIDFGCGVGTWLAVSRALGASIIVGLDGDWVKSAERQISDDNIITVDLSVPVQLDRKFDLAICMEVAEHLPEQRSESLVDDICKASDVALFGAAIPNQGGTEHINEQWQSYWAALFARNGFQPFDAVRPNTWCNSSVDWWYRQNAILYMKPDTASRLNYKAPIATMLDVVHPEMASRRYGVKRKLKHLFKAVFTDVKSRLNVS